MIIWSYFHQLSHFYNLLGILFYLFINYIIYLQIQHLAVDAIVKCDQVNEMEGGALLGFDNQIDSEAFSINDQNGFDESTSCAHAFQVLKRLIQRCLADAVTSGNVLADAMLQHLYRWLCRFLLYSFFLPSSSFLFIWLLNSFSRCSPQSKLHDPAVHELLHKVNSYTLKDLVMLVRKFICYFPSSLSFFFHYLSKMH